MERKTVVGFVTGALAGLALGVPAAYALLRLSPDRYAAISFIGQNQEDARVSAGITAGHEALLASDPVRALALLREAERLAPTSPRVQNNLCVAFIRLERYDEAVSACKAALAADPTFQLARNNLAWAEQQRASAAAAPASANATASVGASASGAGVNAASRDGL